MEWLGFLHHCFLATLNINTMQVTIVISALSGQRGTWGSSWCWCECFVAASNQCHCRVTQAVLDPQEPQDLQARMACQVWMAVMAILESLALLVRWVLQVLLDPLDLQALLGHQGLKVKEWVALLLLFIYLSDTCWYFVWYHWASGDIPPCPQDESPIEEGGKGKDDCY